jgi:hypothetical protein
LLRGDVIATRPALPQRSRLSPGAQQNGLEPSGFEYTNDREDCTRIYPQGNRILKGLLDDVW